jgi:uncharacterized repeat protein (TIGR01451 family)
LRITKTDNATDYVGGIPIQYVIVVSNAGPANVIGAAVTDTFPPELTGITWTCTPSGSASCTANGTGNISDSVNLAAGASLTYTVNATVIASPTGPLTNTATVTSPASVTDPIPGNNSATDTDQLVTPDSTPPDIGTTPDGIIYIVPSGTYLTLQFGTPFVVNGNPGYDLVYYELPQGTNPGIWMDAVILWIGDGRNWYPILNWGDGTADGNTNLQVLLPVPPNPTNCSGEPDNCEVDASLLYNATGIAINLDGIAPPGTYPYIRIFSPSAPFDIDGGVEVDAFSTYP